MALIIYDTADYDSFITVADATTVINSLTLYSTQWSALTTAEQEVYLRIAFRLIDDNVDQDVTPYPDTIPDCVGEAQALIAVQDVVFGFSSAIDTAELGAVKSQKVGTLQVEYYDSKSNSMKYANRIPDMAQNCLADLGFTLQAEFSGMTQSTLGRS